MKLRYQMRGLGIGMIVTALLMGVSAERGIPLSDAEIRAKALELGMVESDSLKLSDISNSSPAPTAGSGNTSDVPGGEDENGTEGTSGEGPESTVDPGSGEENPEGQAPETREAAESEAAEKSAESQAASAQPGDTVTVVIESGVTSYRICIMLEELGLVEDAAEFDTYLCDNGYSRKIDYGTHEIPVGAGEEEIAKIITRNR